MLALAKPDSSIVATASGHYGFTLVFGAISVAFLCFSLYRIARQRDFIPLCFYLGGASAVLIEGALDQLYLLKYSEPMIELYSVFGEGVPLFVLFFYTAFIGLLGYPMFRLLRAGKVTRKLILCVWAGTIVVEGLSEIIPIHFLGLWQYYGAQPIVVFGIPLWMAMINANLAFVPALFVHKLLPDLSGLNQLWIVPMIPTVFAMIQVGVAYPVFNAFNMTRVHDYAYTVPAGLLTCLLSLSMLHFTIKVATGEGLLPARKRVS